MTYMCKKCKQNGSSLGQKFFAWTSSKSNTIQDKAYGRIKHDLFSKLSGKVLEIGPGTGINFDYFPKNISWIGAEPSVAMQKYLLRKANEIGIDAEVITCSVETLPIPDESVDYVICTLVLCSVSSQKLALKEIKRILKPAGSF